MAATDSDIVLLGAGAAHLELLRRCALRPLAGGRLTLVSAAPEVPYPSLLPALIRGERSLAEACIDLGPLAAAAGARLVLAEPTGILPDERLVALAGRPNLWFDLLSVDLDGESVVPASDGPVIPLRPLGGFLARLAALEAAMPDGARVALVGSDPAVAELALALAQRFRGRLRLALVSDAPEPLTTAAAPARRTVRAALLEARVALVSGVQALALREARLALSDGSFLGADAVIWAGGTRGPALLAESGLACDAAGRVVVDPTQRSISHAYIFAASACATEASPSAYRGGAALLAGLRRAARGRGPLLRQVPSVRAWDRLRSMPSLMDLGNGSAVAWYEGLALAGSAVARGKLVLDRWRMRRYAPRPLGRRKTPPRPAPLPALPLRSAPEGLAGPGPATPETASALTPPAGLALVQSVACLRCDGLDDLFVFGQVAAAHALSELHALGARPWTALPIVAISGDRTRRGELRDMLAGAASVLAADGCILLHGHHGAAAETSLGFAVSGLTDPARLPRRTRLRPGDALVLTKPLGSGIVLAGQATGATRAAWLEAAIATMRASNAPAGRILRLHGAGACTAVNGDGLSGSLEPMLRTAEAAAVLWPDAVPVLPGTLALLAPRGMAAVLADPQISGGLLAGVPQARAGACVAALREAGVPAAVIGLVEAPQAGAQLIRTAMA